MTSSRRCSKGCRHVLAIRYDGVASVRELGVKGPAVGGKRSSGVSQCDVTLKCVGGNNGEATSKH